MRTTIRWRSRHGDEPLALEFPEQYPVSLLRADLIVQPSSTLLRARSVATSGDLQTDEASSLVPATTSKEENHE